MPEVNINVPAISANARTGFSFEEPGSYAGTADARTDNIAVLVIDGYNHTGAGLLLEANGERAYVRPRQPFKFAPGGRIRQLFITPDAAVSINTISLAVKGPLLPGYGPRGA